MRRCTGRAELAVYERIIELYAPYVLVRCAAFTNSRRQSQQIGAYVLVCTCLMSSRLDHPGQLGILVEVMLEVVGPDVVSRGDGMVCRDQVDESLIVDERMRELARALNLLERPLREVLVLHQVAGREADELARLLHKPAGEMAKSLARAETRLARHLACVQARGGRAGTADVRSLLAEFAAGLDAGWIQEVGGCAMEYLAGPAGRKCCPPEGGWN